MTSFYAEAAAEALSVLKEFGQQATLTIPGTSTYSPTTGKTTETPTTETRNIVLIPMTRIQYGQQLRSGEFVKMGDLQCLMDADGSVPAADCTITTADGTIYTIYDVKKYDPAGTPVLYDMLVRT